MPIDPGIQALRAHQEWLGYVQPVGLVVSPLALVEAGVYVNSNIIPRQQQFRDHLEDIEIHKDIVEGPSTTPAVMDFPALMQAVFGWEATDLVSDARLDTLEVVLPEYEETLRPTWAVPEFEPEAAGKATSNNGAGQNEANAPQWLMLIQALPPATDFDKTLDIPEHKWQSTPQARFEHLLRETKITIGILFNHTHLRLVYKPREESSGYITFPVEAMAQVDGRPIFAALEMLLCAERLFTATRKQRLPQLLLDSRKFQSKVSTKLSIQVLQSLYELLRGFQAADDSANGELLRTVLRQNPDHVYAGLLNVLLRLVFLLYAEDRELMPQNEVYTRHYSIGGLFERLRADNSRYPDTMNHRYGAWAQLLSLFRLVYDGARHGDAFTIPARQGHLFDPDRYPFLEGRFYGSTRQHHVIEQPPMVSDGIVYRVLNNLLILDGERIAYRALDVEQIGSVYETIMGFNLQVARGRAIAIKPTKAHGAPVTINLEALLGVKPAQRAKWVTDYTEQKITGESLRALKVADSSEALVAALQQKVSPTTPEIVAPGAMILQPSDERRRSGSHYTPRALTEPIVRATLQPILEGLGPHPTPEHILALKVCDPAMGSGAFLVEACRQLAEALVAAWKYHDCIPRIPPDEDEALLARRMVTQRCIYGVDMNPLAVDLAKLSLWLVTLAREHPFTFVDHALKWGDSLVGLNYKQLTAFHWEAGSKAELIETVLKEPLRQVLSLRERIRLADESEEDATLRMLLKESEEALDQVRLLGNLLVASFFQGRNAREREGKRVDNLALFTQWLHKTDDAQRREALQRQIDTLQQGDNPLTPFHWDIEFPEVFQRDNPGFDAFVGNPPFAGKNTLINGTPEGYLDWLKELHEGAHGNADLVAHFFRRCFAMLRNQGSFGLIATNTIGQGDTRATGLAWICTNGGIIYEARKRLKWPGQAAVVVSVVHVFKGTYSGAYRLDGREVPRITAFLFHAGGHENPATLVQNAGKSFQGSIVLGMGFTFDDTDAKGVASPLAEMERLIAENPKNAEVIFPYIGGEEVNSSPTHAHHRYVINFGERVEEECWREWPDLMRIVEEKVKPERIALPPKNNWNRTVASRWWLFGAWRRELTRVTQDLERVLVVPRVSMIYSLTFLPTSMVLSEQLVVFAFDTMQAFSILKSRVHERWWVFQASTFGSADAPRYAPSDCFETFPFPPGYEENATLETLGEAYYTFRAELMQRNNQGLTKTYNRFHDPEETSPDILRLRELHAAMDQAVLDAYGWQDLTPSCDFLLEYEDEEDEEEVSGMPTRQRRKPWRYRWPDAFRDEVLARLLDLNKAYAEQEQLRGAANAKQPSKRKVPRKKQKSKSDYDATGQLF